MSAEPQRPGQHHRDRIRQSRDESGRSTALSDGENDQLQLHYEVSHETLSDSEVAGGLGHDYSGGTDSGRSTAQSSVQVHAVAARWRERHSGGWMRSVASDSREGVPGALLAPSQPRPNARPGGALAQPRPTASHSHAHLLFSPPSSYSS